MLRALRAALQKFCRHTHGPCCCRERAAQGTCTIEFFLGPLRPATLIVVLRELSCIRFVMRCVGVSTLLEQGRVLGLA